MLARFRLAPGGPFPKSVRRAARVMDRAEAGQRSVVWLRDVAGLDGLTNSVCYATDPGRDQRRMAVLFPGDVMDEDAVIPARYRQVSFENAAASVLEHDRSVGSVVVVKSADRLGDTACFANLVSIAPEGNAAPYRPDGHATEHLDKLLKNVGKRLNADAVPRIVLAGFSRGGVVINQVVTELARSRHDEFWSRVDEVRWIDTGNSPGVGAFPLDEAASIRFAEMARRQPIRVLIAGSPFQWKNPFRPSILTERRRFVNVLRPCLSHPHLAVRYHFAERAPNLEDHFAMLVDHLHPENGIDISAGA